MCPIIARVSEVGRALFLTAPRSYKPLAMEQDTWAPRGDGQGVSCGGNDVVAGW